MKKILLIFGTRPEAIKMCPLVLELKSRPCFDAKVCVTGQHREMLDSVLAVFGILPDYDLDIMSPYPEEFNRQAIDIVSQYIFALTDMAKENLLKEGKSPDTIYVTGNTGIDALRYTVKTDYTNQYLDWAGDSKLILITAHRRENLGEPMRNMFGAIEWVLDEHADVKAIYPIHL